MASEYEVVDRVSRDTAELLQSSDDAILAWHDDDVFVLEPRDG
jgi:hypothetical protein